MDEKQIKILVTDDEVDFRELLAFWLKSRGYDVSIASNGREALEKVRQQAPDIIFLDLNMPEMDGLEALKQLRSFNKELPVIIISAFVDDKRAKLARDYGISGVFYKGKDFQEGLVLLESALRTHKQLKK
jgi:CheY-like chemotaxis protein